MLKAELLYSYSRRNTVILQNRVSPGGPVRDVSGRLNVWPVLLTYNQHGREVGRQLPPRDLYKPRIGKHILVAGTVKRERLLGCRQGVW